MRNLLAFFLLIVSTQVFASEGIVQREIVCLAQNIYHEARGEPIQGQTAVAMVTMNRVYSGRYPNTVCDVVYQPYQFSWTSSRPNITELKTWRKTLELAAKVYVNYFRLKDHTKGALFYYAQNQVDPDWAREKEVTRRIGHHTFLR